MMATLTIAPLVGAQHVRVQEQDLKQGLMGTTADSGAGSAAGASGLDLSRAIAGSPTGLPSPMIWLEWAKVWVG